MINLSVDGHHPKSPPLKSGLNGEPGSPGFFVLAHDADTVLHVAMSVAMA